MILLIISFSFNFRDVEFLFLFGKIITVQRSNNKVGKIFWRGLTSSYTTFVLRLHIWYLLFYFHVGSEILAKVKRTWQLLSSTAESLGAMWSRIFPDCLFFLVKILRSYDHSNINGFGYSKLWKLLMASLKVESRTKQNRESKCNCNYVRKIVVTSSLDQ